MSLQPVAEAFLAWAWDSFFQLLQLLPKLRCFSSAHPRLDHDEFIIELLVVHFSSLICTPHEKGAYISYMLTPSSCGNQIPPSIALCDKWQLVLGWGNS
jgi:hypothetical protein